MAKSDAMVAHAKERGETRQKEVLDAIKQMKKRGDKITFYSVQKVTGAAKSYLYSNAAIRKAIEDERSARVDRSAVSKDALIKIQSEKIKSLEKEIMDLKKGNSESYKTRYERLLQEYEDLKLQLRTAYDY